MKPIFFLFFMISLFLAVPAMAHTLYINLVDNDDGTVTVESIYSTGGTGAGLSLTLEDENGKIIRKLKLDENGETIFEIPDQPYEVFLDGGPGHTVRKKGPEKQ